MKDTFDQLKALFSEAEDDFKKVHEKQNKAAATRTRGTLSKIANLSKQLRAEIQEAKSSW